MSVNLPTDPIATALLANFDSLKTEIADRLRREFAKVVAKYDLGNGRMAQSRDGYYNAADGHVMNYASDKGYSPLVSMLRYSFSTTIDDAKVEADAAQQAANTLLAWHTKILGKIGAVESCTILRERSDYMMTVRKAGIAEEVTIKQQIVWKMSKRGSWYAQFPARIYVGTQFVPEAKFKAMVAG